MEQELGRFKELVRGTPEMELRAEIKDAHLRVRQLDEVRAGLPYSMARHGMGHWGDVPAKQGQARPSHAKPSHAKPSSQAFPLSRRSACPRAAQA
eukprot:SAG22_NODE_3670_length_1584_cov_1.645118_3_plen_95_part_00